MRQKNKVGCGCLSMCILVCITWFCCRPINYKFELKISGRVPDLDRYAIIEGKVRDCYDPVPYGYALYYDAMRENGIGSFFLTDRMASHVISFFGGGRVSPDGIGPWDGDSGFFGELPKLEFPGHSNVVEAIQGTAPCLNALMAIETNAVLQCRWPYRDAPESFNVMDRICCWSGIGMWLSGPLGNNYYGMTRDMVTKEAKESITACAIKAAFPNMRTPRIDEERPLEDEFIVMHGRAPLPCRLKMAAQRTFNFHDEDGRLFASLRIKTAPDRLRRLPIDAYEKIYKAIFRQVFAELKPTSGTGVIRGKACYVNDTGVVRDLERTRLMAP
jgi:hypothetical protein